MKPTLPLVAAMLLPVLSGCDRDAPVPSQRENEQLDNASALLNQAPADLDTVNERLPDSNDSGPPTEAGGPSQP